MERCAIRTTFEEAQARMPIMVSMDRIARTTRPAESRLVSSQKLKTIICGKPMRTTRKRIPLSTVCQPLRKSTNLSFFILPALTRPSQMYLKATTPMTVKRTKMTKKVYPVKKMLVVSILALKPTRSMPWRTKRSPPACASVAAALLRAMRRPTAPVVKSRARLIFLFFCTSTEMYDNCER